MEEPFYLCCMCGSISPFDNWTMWQRTDEGGWRPSEEGEMDPMCRCPCCGWEHTDTEDGSGMYDGTRDEMVAQRQQLVTDDPEGFDWLGSWTDRLLERETDWQLARIELREFEHVAGEPLSETAGVAKMAYAFAHHAARWMPNKIVVALSGGDLLGIEPEQLSGRIEVRQYHQDFKGDKVVRDEQDPGVTYSVVEPL